MARADFAEAARLVRPFAEAGNIDAQYGLALFTWPDDVSDPHYAAALTAGVLWLRQAAYGGQATALNLLGSLYELGSFQMPRDPELARCLWDSNHENDADMRIVSRCHRIELDRGYETWPRIPPVDVLLADRRAIIATAELAFIRLDYKTAVKRSLPLAESGDAEVQYDIYRYERAAVPFHHSPEALHAAMHWLRRAAYGGLPQAIDALASNYRDGSDDFPIDRELAECLRAAEKVPSELAACRALETSKGYADSPPFPVVR